MKLGTVVGKVWAERKVPQFVGIRLLIVRPLAHDSVHAGSCIVAADPKGLAAVGDRVVFVTSTDAVEAFDGDAPVNASIVELVDFVE
jgi:ethanolamine utilization protein EutN